MLHENSDPYYVLYQIWTIIAFKMICDRNRYKNALPEMIIRKMKESYNTDNSNNKYTFLVWETIDLPTASLSVE